MDEISPEERVESQEVLDVCECLDLESRIIKGFAEATGGLNDAKLTGRQKNQAISLCLSHILAVFVTGASKGVNQEKLLDIICENAKDLLPEEDQE